MMTMMGDALRWACASALVFALGGCGDDGAGQPRETDDGADSATDGPSDGESETAGPQTSAASGGGGGASSTGEPSDESSGGGSDGSSSGGEDLPQFQPGTIVDIDTGTIEGEDAGDLRIFRGIPFADPPIGNLRFADPAPVTPWEGVLDATQFRAACPQMEIPLFNQPAYGPGPLSEDCLNLNVWAYDDPTPRPVMVFIHGGAYVLGSGSASLYEASELARRADAVLVTINYRLGALGFMATESLADESGNDSAGNYGIKDQVQALDWVRRNIAVFGGDPDNVTIFGESAGGISVCAIMGAPSADGLYHKAIIESGVSCAEVSHEREDTVLGQASAIGAGEAIAAEIGCPPGIGQLNCLRSANADDLVAATGVFGLLLGDVTKKSLPVSPTVDGVFIPEQPLERIAAGEVSVPIIAGTNRDEATLFFGNVVIISRIEFRQQIDEFLGTDALTDPIMDIYPPSDFPLARDAFMTMITDFAFACPNQSLVAAAASAGTPAFLYEFQRVYPGLAIMGSFHALELAYLFGNFGDVAIIPSQPDHEVSEVMQRAWSSFARTGTPLLSSGWPAYSEGQQGAILDVEPSLVDEHEFRGGRCDDLRALGLVP